ncbi:MAG: DUF2334 domain-containing protein [Candidatus Atribacteria bacterium]|nr:MAG: DUF2334 domain-containing protein [Candidatus Atribacteria bacterium]
MNVPTTTDFYNWGEGNFYSADDIKTSCQFAMDQFGTCVLLLHHHTFTDANYNIDPNKIQVLSDVMQWVKSKESDGVELSTIGNHNIISPPPAKKKFIVFRDDDVAPFWSDASAIAVTEAFRTRNVAHVMSIIPVNGAGNKLYEDTVISEYITSIKNDGLTEFAAHGYNHELNEFKDISLADATYKLGESVDILKNVIGENPIAFIAPYHEYNDNTLAAMKTKSLNIISSGNDDITRGIAFKVVDGIYHIPVTSDFYNWGENRDNSLDEIKTSCENAMNSFGGCVILMHHHHFVDSYVNVDANKINKLVDVIDWAKSKESSGLADILTLKDVNLG